MPPVSVSQISAPRPMALIMRRVRDCEKRFVSE
jgi:hypothetical protein